MDTRQFVIDNLLAPLEPGQYCELDWSIVRDAFGDDDELAHWCKDLGLMWRWIPDRQYYGFVKMETDERGQWSTVDGVRYLVAGGLFDTLESLHIQNAVMPVFSPFDPYVEMNRPHMPTETWERNKFDTPMGLIVGWARR